MTLDLAKYGITDVKQVVHNPSYEQLHKDETAEGLVGYEKGIVTELGAMNVMTGIYTGRSPKDKFFVVDEVSKDTVWWTSEEYKKLSVDEFTKAAERYEGNHAGIYEMCKKDYPDILKELESETFTDLLDAGCGPAPMISLLAEKYPNRHYTGLDLTPAMIEQAKKKNITNAEFVVGDCENFPFDENAFDAIVCSNSFHHYPNPQAFFNSVKRCLRPGGRLILRDVTSDNRLLLWFMDNIELPIANMLGHGDVKIARRKTVMECCKKAGLKVEKFEIRKGMRMHCVVRKI